MNKVLFGVITVVAVVCFCGLVPSAAADKMEVIMGESIFSEDNIDMPDDLDKADSAPTAVFSLNYLQDLYATTAPSSGENYNKSAVKAFSAGSTVYLITRVLPGVWGKPDYLLLDIKRSRVRNVLDEFVGCP